MYVCNVYILRYMFCCLSVDNRAQKPHTKALVLNSQLISAAKGDWSGGVQIDFQLSQRSLNLSLVSPLLHSAFIARVLVGNQVLL